MSRTPTQYTDVEVRDILANVRDGNDPGVSNYLMQRHFQMGRWLVTQVAVPSAGRGRPRLKWALTDAGKERLAELSEMSEGAEVQPLETANENVPPDVPNNVPVVAENESATTGPETTEAVTMESVVPQYERSKAQNVEVLTAVRDGTEPSVSEAELSEFYDKERGYVARTDDGWTLTEKGERYLKLSALTKKKVLESA